METLIDCSRCNSNACLVQPYTDDLVGYICFGCGFTTSSEMLEDSEIFNTVLKSAPELYKDIKFIDNKNQVWMPSTITLPNQGMVFVDGTDKDNWQWAGVLATNILPEEKNKFPVNQTHKMDFTNLKYFAVNDYMDALEYIGFFEIKEETL